MDAVPVTDTGGAPPSANEPLTSASVQITGPQLTAEVPATTTARPTMTTLHVVRPTVVTGQSVRSPVVRPQLVSVVKGQTLAPGVRGESEGIARGEAACRVDRSNVAVDVYDEASPGESGADPGGGGSIQGEADGRACEVGRGRDGPG